MRIIENPVRRRIIESLSKEPSYPLQIAKDLGLGQQLVAKHLNLMEDAGIVSSSMKSSPQGPQRKTYLLNKSVSLTINLAPNLFKTDLSSFSSIPEKDHANEALSFLDEVEEILQLTEEERKVRLFKNFIAKIDKKLDELNEKRSLFLYARNIAMKEALKIINRIQTNRTTKTILYHIINENTFSIKELSKSLNLRESLIESVFEELKNIFNL